LARIFTLRKRERENVTMEELPKGIPSRRRPELQVKSEGARTLEALLLSRKKQW
jgi:hypothetical protein